MSTISHEPVRQATGIRRWSELLTREMWASLAIAVMWLSVLFTAIFGQDILNTTVGGTSSSVPSAVVVAFFAFLGTWVVARHGFRGGLATTLNELATSTGLAVRLQEETIPIRAEVAGAAEILGIDPLYVANEGKLVAVVAADAASDALDLVRTLPLGVDAALIGRLEPDPPGLVLLDTTLGGSRIVDMLVGDPLPRIC